MVCIGVRLDEPVGNDTGELIARNPAIAISVHHGLLLLQVGKLRNGAGAPAGFCTIDRRLSFLRIENAVAIGI